MAGPDVAQRLVDVQAGIARAAERSGRTADAVRLIAVSKTVPADRIRQAIDAGVTDLGENRVQEAQAKIPVLGRRAARWHLIGHLQTNKVGKALPLFDVIQSVDSIALARLLSERLLARTGPPLEILFEVNVAGEASKQGFSSAALLDAAPALGKLAGVRPRGLMTVAPLTADPEQVRPVFQQLRELRDRVAAWFGAPFSELSMGMSHDYTVAIEEGATMVRLGTAIFGSRP